LLFRHFPADDVCPAAKPLKLWRMMRYSIRN
jgi:hypothetical protein